MDLYRGAGNPISRHQLTHLTGVSDRKVRAAVHELITQRRLPICSSSNVYGLGAGYYVATTREELEHAVRFIESYRDQAAERARCLREAFAQFEAEQMRLAV